MRKLRLRLHTVAQVERPEIKPKQSGLGVCDPKRQRKRGQEGKKVLCKQGKWNDLGGQHQPP